MNDCSDSETFETRGEGGSISQRPINSKPKRSSFEPWKEAGREPCYTHPDRPGFNQILDPPREHAARRCACAKTQLAKPNQSEGGKNKEERVGASLRRIDRAAVEEKGKSSAVQYKAQD